MRSAGTLPLTLIAAALASACQLIVDPVVPDDLGVSDRLNGGDGMVLSEDLGPDMGPDSEASPDIPDPSRCTVDADCESQFGLRFRCVRNSCFNLDAECTQTVRVTDSIETSQTWYPDRCYELGGTIFVKNGATLTIQAGTRITGLNQAAALIVTRTGRIMASGTEDDPIVMTSGRPVGMRQPGDWGGLALLGRAPINVGEDALEGLEETEDTTYGGGQNPDPEYNCGTVRYTRIEFAGFEFANNNELNSLTLAGCGFDTLIEYVQVHYGSDDGVEVFGGEVGMQWIVISRAQDDSLDWDQGWLGFAQYVAILQDEPRPDLNVNIFTGGDNGIEADSLSPETPGVPRSRPKLYNFTMVGSQAPGSRTRGMILREGTSAVMRNFLMMNYAQGMWDIRDLTADCMRRPLGATCTSTDTFVMDGLLLHNMGPGGNDYVLPDSTDNDSGFDESAFITTATDSRFLLLDRETESPTLVQPDINRLGDIDLRPSADSVADIRDQNPPPFVDPPEQVQDDGRNFIGAFAPGGINWMQGWTSFPDN